MASSGWNSGVESQWQAQGHRVGLFVEDGGRSVRTDAKKFGHHYSAVPAIHRCLN